MGVINGLFRKGQVIISLRSGRVLEMRKRRFYWHIIWFWAVLFLVPRCYAMDITLAWEASPEAVSYVVYWGSSSGIYTDSVITKDTTYNLTLPDGRYYFAVRVINSKGTRSAYSREVCVLDPNSLPEPYDRGWEITRGDLKGFKILFNSADMGSLKIGPENEVPPLSLPGVEAVGALINLQPSGAHFKVPVRVFIPCPGYSDGTALNLYYFDGLNWVRAHDPDDSDNIQPGAQGWLAPLSRRNHIGDPPTIEIQIYDNSPVQLGVPLDSSGGGHGEGSRSGGCLISTSINEQSSQGDGTPSQTIPNENSE